MKIIFVWLLLCLASQQLAAQLLTTPYDSTGGELSLRDTQVPVGELKKRLQSAHHLDVFIDQYDAAELVSVDLTNVPVEEALKRAVPPKYRFAYRPAMSPDFTARAASDRVVSARQPGRLVSKPAGSRQVAPEQIRIMAEAPNASRTASGPAVVVRTGAMPPAASLRAVEGTRLQAPEVTYGPLPAQPTALAQGEQHLRMTVRVAADGTYQPVSYRKVAGALVEPQVAQGNFIYQAYDGDQLAFVGSFQDPLEQHSYSPNEKEHLLLPVKEVYITIALPSRFLNATVQRNATVQFGRLDEAVLTTPLRQLPRTAPTVKVLGTIRSPELMRVIR